MKTELIIVNVFVDGRCTGNRFEQLYVYTDDVGVNQRYVVINGIRCDVNSFNHCCVEEKR